MQLVNRLNKNNKTLIVSAAVTALVSIGNAAGSDSVKIMHNHYEEGDERIVVDYTVLDFKKDFGTNFTFSASASFDEITGGTPIWDTKSGASPCSDEAGNYICGDPENRPGNLLGDGQTNLDNFEYKNIEMVDERKAFNASLTYRTPARNEWSFGGSYSAEGDYKSKDISLSYLHYLDSSKNQSISAGVSIMRNSSHFYMEEAWKDVNIENYEIGFTQIFSAETLGQITFFRTSQSGALTNAYQTVIRKINEADVGDDPIYRYYRAKEVRPDKKEVSGIALNTISQVKDDLILHGSYRYYKDDWDISSHTLETKAYYNIHKNVRLAPSIRYYTQSEANFFKNHTKNESDLFSETGNASSDDRLGTFHSTTYGFGIESDLNTKWDFSIDAATQKTSYGLDSKWVSLGVNYAF
jgi:hypothetical protein